MIIDYSTSRPPVALLKTAGVTAVGRYLGWNGEPGFQNLPGKNLTVPEKDELLAAGISIWLSFEYQAQAAILGAPQGAKDGRLATRQLHDLGAPPGLTVYFAVDFDIADYAPGSADPKAKLGPAAAYFEAINALKPAYKVGVYGGYYAVKRVLDASLASMGWQTTAWSGGQWDPRAVLRQLASQWQGMADVDLHTASGPDFGQWRPPAPPPPHGPYRHTADGTKSLEDIARARATTAARLLQVSRQAYTPADASVLEGWLAGVRLGAGVPYYTSTP